MSSNNQLNKSSHQLDSSQILVEIQLGLIYYLETILSFFKSLATSALNQINLSINGYFGDSIVFKCKTYFLNNTVRRKRLLEWLNDKLKAPFTPSNFTTDWCDGIRLCALCEVISPGSCPRYDLLNPNNAHNNIKLGLNLIQSYLDVKPNITVKEIYECSSEAKFVHLLSQIKIAYAKKLIKSTGSPWLKLDKLLPNAASTMAKFQNKRKLFSSPTTDFFFNRCSIKGMGLISGVRSRRARFSIFFYDPLPVINLIFEIVGPNGSFSSEKVVAEFNQIIESDDDDDYSNERSAKQLEIKSYDQMQALIIRAAMQQHATDKNLKIPFFYKLFTDHILITYVPLFTGDHFISIIWQGQHVFNSPYTVSIEESEYLDGEITEIGPKFEPGFQYPVCLLKSHRNWPLENMGTVVRTKVVKKSIVANGKEYDYNDFMNSNYREDIHQNPNDTNSLEHVSRKSLSFTESKNSFSNTSKPTKARNQEQREIQNGNGAIDSEKTTTTLERVTKKITKISNRKVSFEKLTNNFAKKIKEKTKIPLLKGSLDNGKEDQRVNKEIPNIKIVEENNFKQSQKCPTLKEMMDQNSKQFNENLNKLKKTLEQNLSQYKTRLETNL